MLLVLRVLRKTCLPDNKIIMEMTKSLIREEKKITGGKKTFM